MHKYLVIPVIVIVSIFTSVISVQAHDGEDHGSHHSTAETTRPLKTARPIEELRSMRAEQLKTMEAKRTELKTMRAEQRSAIASARAEAKAKLCERIGEHLGDVVNRYQDNHQAHVEQYQKLKVKVQEVIAKLKKEGLNTTALEATLPTLESKIKEVSTQHAQYIDKLNALKSLGCNAAETDLKAAREAARSQLAKVRIAVEDVRNYYKNTVRTEIIKLKTARASLSPKALPTVAASANVQ